MKAKGYKVVDKNGNLISHISCTEKTKEKIASAMPDCDIIEDDENESGPDDDR